MVQFVELPPNSSKEEVEAIMIAAEPKFMDLLEPAYNFSLQVRVE